MSTETKMKNLQKAGKILEDFDFSGPFFDECHYCAVRTYFRDPSINHCFTDADINCTEDVLRWKADDWMRFIVERGQDIRAKSRFSPDMVISIVIEFQIRPTSGSLYQLECTNLSKINGFDRFVANNSVNGELYELFFDEDQIAMVHGINDAIELASILHDHGEFRSIEDRLPLICKCGSLSLM